MKERILKWGVPLFLAAILIVPGVLASVPSMSQAAGGTVYKVTLVKPSPTQNWTSINSGAAANEPAENSPASFQMVIGTKVAKDGSVPVTIVAKTFKGPSTRFAMIGGGGYADSVLTMAKDAVGKYYPKAGAPVNINVVAGAKGSKITFSGSGAAGSMVIPVTTVDVISLESTGKVVMQTIIPYTMTTGTAYIIVQGTKTRLEGKAFPDSDKQHVLPSPFQGSAIDLNAGTGTIVGVGVSLGQKNKTFGLVDCVNAMAWTMQISK
jgi:hypothetical protein